MIATCIRAEEPTPLPQHDQAVLIRLEQRFSEIESIKSDFTQEKTLAIFNKPLILKGWVALDNKGHFAWRVQHPLRYSLIVADGVISQWDEDSDKVQRMNLSDNPVLSIVFEQLTQWFSGRYLSFSDKYDMVLQQENPTTISFRPKPGTIEYDVIRRVVIRFAEDEQYLDQIVIDEANGDETALTFQKTLINPLLPQSTWRIHANGT
jgi:hypothetical protein